MEKNARTLIMLAVLVGVASAVLCVSRMQPAHSGVKRGNVTSNNPQAIDGAVRKVMEEMPPLVTKSVDVTSPTGDFGINLGYDYGDTSRYIVLLTQATAVASADDEISIRKVDGDSVWVDRDVTSTETYYILAAPVGVWGE